MVKQSEVSVPLVPRKTSDQKEHLFANETGKKSEPLLEIAEDSCPVDKWHLVYLIILLHGVGTLMPWNMFITITNKYYTNYKMAAFENGSYVPTTYSGNFLSYLGIASQLPNLLLNFINIFIVVKGDLTKRISFSLLIVAAVIGMTLSFVYMDTWSWQGGFFVVTLVSVVVLNAFNGIYQNSIFGLAADFPFKYTNAVIIGNNLCGTFVSVLEIITSLVSDNIENSTFAYFSISLVTLALCFASFFVLRKQKFYKHYSALAARQREDGANTGPSSAQDYIDAFKQGYPQMVNVFLVFFVTLCIFPGMMVNVTDWTTGQTEKDYNFPVPLPFFYSITTFLLFNVFAFIGSMLAGKFQYPAPKQLWIPVYARIVLIPFVAFCNFKVDSRRFPVLFDNTWLFLFVSIIMSVSSGYLSGLSMMYTPRVVDSSKSRIASMMAGFFLIAGIVSGLAFTMVVVAVMTV